MARYILLSPVVGSPPGNQYRKWASGTTISDSAANALPPNYAIGFPGDLVWPSLCASAGSAKALGPLDAAAAAITGTPIVTAASVVTGNLTVGGVGLDAGD